MGAIEAQVNTSKPTTLNSTGLQLNRSSGITKPRVIHTYSPRVYKIEPEEFLDLVQKLTGKTVPQPKRPTTIQFFETDASKSDFKTENSRSQQISVAQSNFSNSDETLLSSPRLVTLNFLPLLTTPRTRTN